MLIKHYQNYEYFVSLESTNNRFLDAIVGNLSDPYMNCRLYSLCNRGKCVRSEENDFVCACEVGYYGTYCKQETPVLCNRENPGENCREGTSVQNYTSDTEEQANTDSTYELDRILLVFIICVSTLAMLVAATLIVIRKKLKHQVRNVQDAEREDQPQAPRSQRTQTQDVTEEV